MTQRGGLGLVWAFGMWLGGAGLAALACDDVGAPPDDPGVLPSHPGPSGEGGTGGTGGFATSGAAGVSQSGSAGLGGSGCGAFGGFAGEAGGASECGAGGTLSEPPPIPSGNRDCSAGACRHGGNCIEASGITCDCPSSELSVCEAVRFRSLGFLRDGNASAPRAIDRTGSVLIGTSSLMRRTLGGGSIEPGSHRAWRWTLATGVVPLELPEGVGESHGNAISSDGSVVIATREGQGFRLQGGSMNPIPEIEYNSAIAIAGASADAELLVGVRYGQAMNAVRWSAASGLETLDSTPPEETGAYAISGDGRIVVGIAGRLQPSGAYEYRPVRWPESGSIEDLPVPSGVTWAVPYEIDADGAVIVGHGMLGDAGLALRWTPAGVEVLPNVTDTVTAAAYAVSDDGSVIGGRSDVATVWLADGPHRVTELLEGVGVDLTGWTLETVWLVSGDGRVIVGDGYVDGEAHSWIAWLP